MKKLSRKTVRIAGGIILFLVLSWTTFYLVILSNEEKIKALVTDQINLAIKGHVYIGQIDLDFIKSFPALSFHLDDVIIQDSLWNEHHRDIFTAQKIYISTSIFNLLIGRSGLSKITVNNGTACLYTDECGYSNLNRSNDVAFNKGKRNLPEFHFRNFRFIIENKGNNSFHDFEFAYLKCDNTQQDDFLRLHVDMDMHVHSMTFNLDKGSYARDEPIRGKFNLDFQVGEKITLDKIKLNISDQAFIWDGTFLLDSEPMSYDITITTKQIPYPTAVALLTDSLQSRFKKFKIPHPLDAEAHLKGKMAYKVIPEVNTSFSFKDIDMDTPIGKLSECTFSGSFSNHVDSLQSPGDKNTRLELKPFKGNWSSIPLTSDQISITNFIDPILACDLQSEFQLSAINEVSESTTIQFLQGIGKLDVAFDGPITENGSLESHIQGTLDWSKASIQYVPRNLVFTECSGQLVFKEKDVLFKNIKAKTGNTHLTMNGAVANLLAILDLNPEQLTMEWKITTPALHLSDFTTYLGRGVIKTAHTSSRKNKLIKTAENIDRMLRDGSAKLTIVADQLTYKKFKASKVNATVEMIQNKVLLREVKLQHAGGGVRLKGELVNNNQSNFFDLDCDIDNVAIPQLFNAFDNFGQDAITGSNMKGILTAKIIMAGHLTDKALIQENTLEGHVDFKVEKGELNRFEPVMKIAETAFKNRDFSQIQFGDLTSQMDIHGSAIHMHKMEIRSNVVVLFTEGIYDTRKGTDMSIQVPLSNLSKEENASLENTGKAGVNIRLRAKTSDDGTLKVSWDPL
ncbi:MAG: hypothetical protein ACSLE0_14720, partial [Chitinophagaceae bacterium]